jgi:hypothetical protein
MWDANGKTTIVLVSFQKQIPLQDAPSKDKTMPEVNSSATQISSRWERGVVFLKGRQDL